MRQLNSHPAQRGMTLVELMVAFAIASLLALAAAPWFADYGTNARLREGGNMLFTEALFAQTEAIKRNRLIRLATTSTAITVSDWSDPANPVVLRTRSPSADVLMEARTVDFSSSGWPSNLAAVSINLSHATAVCSADTRCPGLRVEAGGALNLCGNQLSC